MNPPRSPSAPARITLAIALAGTLALIVACGGDEEVGGGEDGGSALQTVPLTASDFSFSPGMLTVQATDAFDFVLTNAGNVPHTFTIDELDVDAEVAAGEETTISMTSSKSGEFTFYCRFHRNQGMQGQLTVSGADPGSESESTVPPDNDPYYDY